MTTSYTTLLGFALPVTGELSGTWGDVVNNSITQLTEDSIAGVATASVAAGNWTLTTTGLGVDNQARKAILIPTGSPGVSRNIIAPSQSKAYIVINQSDAAVVVKGSATTGVTIPSGVTALVAWNGSDFINVRPYSTEGTAGQVLTSGGAGAAPTWETPTSELPSQTGHAGQYLTTDGTNASWAATSGGGITAGQSIAFDLVFSI